MKLNSEAYRIKTVKLLFIIAAWLLAAVYFISVENLSVSHFISVNNLQIDEKFEYARHLSIHLLAALFGGIVLGGFEIFYLRNHFRNRTFAYVIAVKSLFYSCSLIVLIVCGSFLYNSFFLKQWIFSPQVISIVKFHIFSGQFWSTVINWSLVFLFTQFVLQVSDRFGHGVLFNSILGKYHQPAEEQRIFMFLDIKSSTAIAEKLGNTMYYSLLNDFYYDITKSIIYSKGEIYQYVGDEIVVSWKMKKGIENANCLQCFFNIVDVIQDLSAEYQEKYGLVPQFKAGMHYGNVTVGEMGTIKTEIAFSGDVLNTASRIQESCNKYNQKLLISEDLLKRLPLDGLYKSEEIGSIVLRGKKNQITLFSIKNIPD